MKSILILTNKSNIDTVPKLHENQDENIIYFSGENISANLAEYAQVLAQRNVDEIHIYDTYFDVLPNLIYGLLRYNETLAYRFEKITIHSNISIHADFFNLLESDVEVTVMNIPLLLDEKSNRILKQNDYLNALISFLIKEVNDFKNEIEARWPHYFNEKEIYIPDYEYVVFLDQNNQKLFSIHEILIQLGKALNLSIVVNSQKATSPINDLFYYEVLKNYTLNSNNIAFKQSVEISLEKLIDDNNAEEKVKQNNFSLIETFQNRSTISDSQTINYFVSEPKKEVIIIINALGLPINLWESFITIMRQHYQIVIWETRCGDIEEGGMEAIISMDQHASDIDAIIKEEQLSNVNILGWCNGAKIGIIAATMNASIKSLILFAPTFKGIQGIEPIDTQFEVQLNNLFGQVEKKPQNAGVLAQFFSKMVTRKLALEKLTEADILGYNDEALNPKVFVPMANAEYLINYGARAIIDENYNIIPIIEQVTQKTLFLLGENDAAVSNELIKQVAGKFAKADIILLKGGSHYMHIQNTQLICNAIIAFFNNSTKYELLSNRITSLNYDNFII